MLRWGDVMVPCECSIQQSCCLLFLGTNVSCLSEPYDAPAEWDSRQVSFQPLRLQLPAMWNGRRLQDPNRGWTPDRMQLFNDVWNRLRLLAVQRLGIHIPWALTADVLELDFDDAWGVVRGMADRPPNNIVALLQYRVRHLGRVADTFERVTRFTLPRDEDHVPLPWFPHRPGAVVPLPRPPAIESHWVYAWFFGRDREGAIPTGLFQQTSDRGFDDLWGALHEVFHEARLFCPGCRNLVAVPVRSWRTLRGVHQFVSRRHRCGAQWSLSGLPHGFAGFVLHDIWYPLDGFYAYDHGDRRSNHADPPAPGLFQRYPGCCFCGQAMVVLVSYSQADIPRVRNIVLICLQCHLHMAGTLNIIDSWVYVSLHVSTRSPRQDAGPPDASPFAQFTYAPMTSDD